MAHLVDSEMVGAGRFRRVIAEENPTLMGHDEKAWAANLDYGRRNPADDLELFRRARRLNTELLSGLPAAAFDRVGTIRSAGRTPARWRAIGSSTVTGVRDRCGPGRRQAAPHGPQMIGRDPPACAIALLS